MIKCQNCFEIDPIFMTAINIVPWSKYLSTDAIAHASRRHRYSRSGVEHDRCTGSVRIENACSEMVLPSSRRDGIDDVVNTYRHLSEIDGFTSYR